MVRVVVEIHSLLPGRVTAEVRVSLVAAGARSGVPVRDVLERLVVEVPALRGMLLDRSPSGACRLKVLVLKGKRILTDDDVLQDDDRIRILPQLTGG